MKKMLRRTPELSRERFVNPHSRPFKERAKLAGAADLRENFRIEHLPGGYSRVVPLDPTGNLKL